MIYVNFLSREKDNFVSDWKKRSTKVFKRLSVLVGTKNNTQCKTHHQKMEKSYGSVEGIIRKILSPEASEQAEKNIPGIDELIS